MFAEIRKSRIAIQFGTMFLFLIIFLSMVVGKSYAHYEAAIAKEVGFQYVAETGQIQIRGADSSEIEKVTVEEEIVPEETIPEETAPEEGIPEESVQEEQITSAYFVLSNKDGEKFCGYDQKATLSMVATIGLGNPNDFMITLVDGGASYMAVCSDIIEGTELYATYGPGWIYHFYDSAGEEVEWQFPGTQLIERVMQIMVIGASEMPATLNLIVNARASEI